MQTLIVCDDALKKVMKHLSKKKLNWILNTVFLFMLFSIVVFSFSYILFNKYIFHDSGQKKVKILTKLLNIEVFYININFLTSCCFFQSITHTSIYGKREQGSKVGQKHHNVNHIKVFSDGYLKLYIFF